MHEMSGCDSMTGQSEVGSASGDARKLREDSRRSWAGREGRAGRSWYFKCIYGDVEVSEGSKRVVKSMAFTKTSVRWKTTPNDSATYRLLLLAHTVQNLNLKLPSSSRESVMGVVSVASLSFVPSNPIVVESGSAGGGGGGGGTTRRLGSADIVKDV